MFLVFVTCLFLVVYGNRGYSRYQLTASLENVFKESFEEVKGHVFLKAPYN